MLPPRTKDRFVHDRCEQLGFENLLPEEKDYILVWWLSAEVVGGSFAQYFSNSYGDDALQTFAALKRCGATGDAELLMEALDLFAPVGGYTADRDERNHRLEQLESLPHAQPQGAFCEVSRRLQQSQEATRDLALKRVKDAYRREGIDAFEG
jgi:hypothetical protein